MKPNKTILKSVAYTMLALAIVNRVGAAAPVKRALYGQ